MVDTPSSSHSFAEEVGGGRIVDTEDPWDWDVSEEANTDRMDIPAMIS